LADFMTLGSWLYILQLIQPYPRNSSRGPLQSFIFLVSQPAFPNCKIQGLVKGHVHKNIQQSLYSFSQAKSHFTIAYRKSPVEIGNIMPVSARHKKRIAWLQNTFIAFYISQPGIFFIIRLIKIDQGMSVKRKFIQKV